MYKKIAWATAVCFTLVLAGGRKVYAQETKGRQKNRQPADNK